MSMKKFSWVVLQCWVPSILFFRAYGDGSVVSVEFLKASKLFSRLNSAKFLLEVLVSVNENCTDCSISCKSWMMPSLQIVELERFHTWACRMGFIRLRSAAMALKELAVLAITGLLLG